MARVVVGPDEIAGQAVALRHWLGALIGAWLMGTFSGLLSCGLPGANG